MYLTKVLDLETVTQYYMDNVIVKILGPAHIITKHMSGIKNKKINYAWPLCTYNITRFHAHVIHYILGTMSIMYHIYRSSRMPCHISCVNIMHHVSCLSSVKRHNNVTSIVISVIYTCNYVYKSKCVPYTCHGIKYMSLN